MDTAPAPELYDLTSAAVAELLHVSVNSVRRWSEAGELGFIVTPGGHRRYRRSEIEAWLERHRREAAS